MHTRIKTALYILASLLCLVSLPASRAHAEFYVYNNRGGQIGPFMAQINDIRSTGALLRIGGNCLSACTLALALPRSQICFEKDAVLGFHAAWVPDQDGRPVISDQGTLFLWKSYPQSVRNWLIKHGGLSRTMLFIKGQALLAFAPRCKGRRSPTSIAAFALPQREPWQAYGTNRR